MDSRSRFSLHSSIFSLLAAVASAASPAPAPAPGADCLGLFLNLQDCLSYVAIGGSANRPQGTCCSGLKTVIDTDAKCLCEGFKNSGQFGIQLNMTRSMTLPAACNLPAPPIGDCGLSSAPGGAPAHPPLVPSPVPTPGGSGGGSGSSPVPSPSGSGGGSGSSPLATSMELLLKACVMALAISFALF